MVARRGGIQEKAGNSRRELWKVTIQRVTRLSRPTRRCSCLIHGIGNYKEKVGGKRPEKGGKRSVLFTLLLGKSQRLIRRNVK